MINNNFLSVMSSSSFLPQKIIFVIHFNKSVTNDKGEFNFKRLFKEFTVKLEAQSQDTNKEKFFYKNNLISVKDSSMILSPCFQHLIS